MSRELLLSLRDRLERINRDDDGDCYMNESADALVAIEAELAKLPAPAFSEEHRRLVITIDAPRLGDDVFAPVVDEVLRELLRRQETGEGGNRAREQFTLHAGEPREVQCTVVAEWPGQPK